MIKDLIDEYHESADKILRRISELEEQLTQDDISYEQRFSLRRRITNLECIAAETRRTAYELERYEREKNEREREDSN